MNIKAVFFDAGHTLTRPLDGDWFHNDGYFAICERHGVSVPRGAVLTAAAEAGYAFLDKHHHEVPDIESEEEQFRAYHAIVLERLGLAASDQLAAELGRWAVQEVNFEPFEGALTLLDRVRAKGLPMAVLTDAWPSVRPKFAALGLLDYFDAFVVSAEEGCTKPDFGMFEPALRALRVAPHEVAFIDDGPAIVEGARKLGFQAHLIDLESKHPDREAIRSLDEAARLLGV